MEQQQEEEFDDQTEEELQENCDLHEWMLYLRMQPGSELQEAELGLREIDQNFNWSTSFSNYSEPHQLRNFIETRRQDHLEIETNVEMPDVLFSIEQQKVLDVVLAQIHFVRTGIRTPQFRQSVIIQGKVGSSKSTLIKAIKATLSQELGNDSFIVMAPTGAAAANIQASTLHSTLKINIDPQLQTLGAVLLKKTSGHFSKLSFCYY